MSLFCFDFLQMSIVKQSRTGMCSFCMVFILFNKNTLLSLRCVCCRFWKFYQWRLSEHCTVFWGRKETFSGGEIFLAVWSIWTGQYLKDNPVKVKCLYKLFKIQSSGRFILDFKCLTGDILIFFKRVKNVSKLFIFTVI